MFTKLAALAPLKAALLGATHSAPTGHRLPLNHRPWRAPNTTAACSNGEFGRGAACV